MEKKKAESPVDRAETAALWGLMLREQTRKALNEQANDAGYSDEHPDVVAACMQAGSVQLLIRALDELRAAVDRIE